MNSTIDHIEHCVAAPVGSTGDNSKRLERYIRSGPRNGALSLRARAADASDLLFAAERAG
jgi:hypothetical protein